jgi:glycosyltransferase involved in cell wall biosynthesis
VVQRSAKAATLVRRNRVAVTAVVATYNEEGHITACLQNLLEQRDVPGDIEILVIDGMSTDATPWLVRAMPEYGTRIRLIQNPRKLQVYAWNTGIREARGEYFAMIVAHAEYGPRYIASCLETLSRTGAAAVGGVQRPIGSGALGRAIAWCMASAFGVGNASFRYADREIESDSVFSIFTRVDLLRRMGGYDERIPFDEDSEMNYRIAAQGGRLVTSPHINVRYHVRRTLRALARQMYCYGYWRRFTQLLHPREVPLRTYAPAALAVSLATSVALLGTPLRILGLVVPAVYGAFTLLAAARAAKHTGPAALLVPAVLATMHCAYGAGWIAGVLSLRKRREIAFAT